MVDLLILLARILFGGLFIVLGLGHFTNTEPMAKYAEAKGVPAPKFMVIVSGLLAIAGGLSVMLGYYAEIGAILLLIFLVPVTLMMHRFWGIDDAAMKQNEMIAFLKNLALIGTALMVLYFGSGPYSIN